VRLAILISLAALGLGGTARADDAPPTPAPLTLCEVGQHGGYLVSVNYAEKHRADILATLPDEPEVTDFWKVTEQIVIMADRTLRETIEDGAKDPTQLFPSLTPGGDESQPDSIGYQRNELKLIVEHYNVYQRQYVGLIIDGQHIVLMNYAVGPQLDAAAGYIFIHRVFEKDTMRFVQARFNWDEKTLTNVSMYGTWQDAGK
jgi:hypothetical protein